LAVASTKGRAQKARPFSQRTPARRFWENFKALASALLFFIVLRAFFLEAYRIPSGSMEGTLLAGDFLFIDKAFYTPRRGDLVVFQSVEEPGRKLVKRIIGLPGDTVSMEAGGVIRNGAAIRA